MARGRLDADARRSRPARNPVRGQSLRADRDRSRLGAGARGAERAPRHRPRRSRNREEPAHRRVPEQGLGQRPCHPGALAALRRRKRVRGVRQAGDADRGNLRHRPDPGGAPQARGSHRGPRRRGCGGAGVAHRDPRRPHAGRGRGSANAFLRRAAAGREAGGAAAARPRLRRHPLGGQRAARPDRDPRLAPRRRAGPPAHARASGPDRLQAQLGQRPQVVHGGRPRAAGPRGLRGAGAEAPRPGRPRRPRGEAGRDVRGQPALHRGARGIGQRARDRRRREAPDLGAEHHRRPSRRSPRDGAKGRPRRVGHRQGLLGRSPRAPPRRRSRSARRRSTHSSVGA